MSDHIKMPTDVGGRVGFFDRFAGHASDVASRAPFFAACVLLILVWAPTLAFLKFDRIVAVPMVATPCRCRP